MKLSFSTVVEYAKNLFPNLAPVSTSDNPVADAAVLAHLSSDMFYTKSQDSNTYWYYFTKPENVSLARYIMRTNGVEVKYHNSRYYYHEVPVLRVRRSILKQQPVAKAFVDMVMQQSDMMGMSVDDMQVQARLNQIKQKMK